MSTAEQIELKVQSWEATRNEELLRIAKDTELTGLWKQMVGLLAVLDFKVPLPNDGINRIMEVDERFNSILQSL